jgi:4-amino-4-deoxy-L-arabinose transferase-like glycosyltransferase
MKQLPWKRLLCVFLLAFAIRGFFALALHAPADTADMEALNDLALGGGFSISQAPLYPLFLRATYALFGAENLVAVFLLQALVGSLSAVFIMIIGSRFWSERTGFIAGLIATIHPDFIFYGCSLEMESLAVFCICALMAVGALPIKDARRAALQGALCGLGALIHANLVLLLPGVIITARKRLIACIAFLAIVIPWIAVNSASHRQFALAQNARDYAASSMFRYFAENNRSVYRQMNRIYVNAIYLYNSHYEDSEETSPASKTTLNISYYVRKYSYLVLLLVGSFAAVRYLRAEHLSTMLPPLAAIVLLMLLVMLEDGRHRIFIEPLLIIYLARMLDRKGAVQEAA